MQYKSVVITEPYKVELLEKVYSFEIEDPNEVIVKNHYSHISAGTELACLAGTESFLDIPGTPGYTAVGEVIERGDNNTHLRKGDIVYTFGPHAEYFKIDTSSRWGGVCIKLPEGLKEDYAAFTHMGGIAITSLRAANIELGDVVLITGLGPIGILAAQMAQLQGATVIATDINDVRIDIAQQCGISVTCNTQKEDVSEIIAEKTNQKGVDTYIDATGLSPVIEEMLEYLSFKGEAILLGSPRAPYNTNLTEVLRKVHLLPQSLTMKGALEFTFPTQENEFVKHSIERNSRIILDLINNQNLLIQPFYTHKISPAQAQKAYDGLRDKKDEYIGVVFDWQQVR